MSLDNATLRLGGVYFDVGFDTSRLPGELNRLQAELDRTARGVTLRVRTSVEGSRGSSGGGSTPASGGTAKSTGIGRGDLLSAGSVLIDRIGAALKPIQAQFARVATDLSRGLDAVVDNLRDVVKHTATSASYHHSTDLAAYDIRLAEKSEYNSAHARRLMRRARGIKEDLAPRGEGYLLNLPADVRYMHGAGFDATRQLLPRGTDARAAAQTVAAGTAEATGQAGATLIQAAAELVHAAHALEHAAGSEDAAARAVASHGAAQLGPGIRPTGGAGKSQTMIDALLTSGAFPLGSEDLSKTEFVTGSGRNRPYFRAPRGGVPPGAIAGTVEPADAAAARRHGPRGGFVDLGALAKVGIWAGKVAARFGIVYTAIHQVGGAFLDLGHQATAGLGGGLLAKLALIGKAFGGLKGVAVGVGTALAHAAPVVGKAIGTVAGYSPGILATYVAFRGFKNSFGDLQRVAAAGSGALHGVAFGLNRVQAAGRWMERGWGNLMKATRIPRAVLGGGFKLALAPLQFGLRVLGLWDHRAGAATNTIRLLGKTAQGIGHVLASPFTGSAKAVLGLLSGLKLVAMFAIPSLIGAFATMAVRGVQGISHFHEAMNRVRGTFGNATKGVEDFATGISAKFGLVKSDVLDLQNTIGEALAGKGVDSGKIGGMANQMAGRVEDVASYYGANASDVAGTFGSAIRGGRLQGLGQYGVVIDEDQVKSKAVQMGLSGTTDSVNEASRALATYQLILDQTTKSEGNLGRSNNTTAGLMRELKGRFEESANAIGKRLEPAFDQLMLLISEIFTGAKRMNTAFRDAVQSAADAIAGFVRFLRQCWADWDDAVGLAKDIFLQWGANIADTIDWVGQAFETFFDWMSRNWNTILGDMGRVYATYVSNLVQTFHGAWEQMQRLMTGQKVDWSKMALQQQDWQKLFDFSGVEIKTPALKLPELKLSDAFGADMAARLQRIMSIALGREPGQDVARANPNPEAAEGDKDKKAKDRAGELMGAKELLDMMQRSVFDKDSKNLERVAKGVEGMREDLKGSLKSRIEAALA